MLENVSGLTRRHPLDLNSFRNGRCLLEGLQDIVEELLGGGLVQVKSNLVCHEDVVLTTLRERL